MFAPLFRRAYVSGSSPPSARHTRLYYVDCLCILFARISSVGIVNTRLSVAVKPTGMHALVCPYEGPIYRLPLYYNCAVQCDDAMHTVRTT